jgi:hypothetical protein
MIIKLLEWFINYPALYYLFGLAAVFLFVALVVPPDNSSTQKRVFEYALFATVALILFAWRWPMLLWENPMNPDEGWWPAGALKATVDFAPWRGFDGMTSGPLNAYILVLPALLGARISFFSTRVIGLCLLVGTITALYYTVKWTYGQRVARLSIVPPVLFLSLARNWNFLHFSSETFPLFLTTVAFAAAVYVTGGDRSKVTRFLGCIIAGLCLGSAGFAKLQAVPIALTILAFLAIGIFVATGNSGKEKSIEMIVATVALLAVPGAIVLSLWLTGEWHHAVLSYLTRSSSYVSNGEPVGLSFLFQTAPEYTTFLVGSLIVVVVGGSASLFKRSLRARVSLPLASSIALLLAFLFTIFVSRHPFPHYLLFSVMPLGWCVANALRLLEGSKIWKGRNALVVPAYVALFLIPSLGVACSAGPGTFLKESTFNFRWIGSPQAAAIARYTPPGSRIAIWGWAPQYYVQTGTIMATRDAETGRQILPGPDQQYFRDRFMSDLRAHRANVIVDAVAPVPGGYQFTDRATQGHETFPELAEFVRDYYTLKEDVSGVRIFGSKTR